MSDYYPIFINLKGRLVVIVGGGSVAYRKARMLLPYGAAIRVISPVIDDGLLDMVEDGRVEIEQREYTLGDLCGADVVFIATDNPEVNESAWKEARSRKIWVNTVDVPDRSDFISASIVDRGDLQIAISTSGACPRLARRIREELSEKFGPEYQVYLEILRSARSRVVGSLLPEPKKRDVMDALIESEILDLVLGGNIDKANAIADQVLRDAGI